MEPKNAGGAAQCLVGGSPGDAPGQLRSPTDVALVDTAAGTWLYVCDSGNHRVQRLLLPHGDPRVAPRDATVVAGGRGAGDGADQLSWPVGIHVTPEPDPALYVADKNNHRVLRFDQGAAAGVVVAGGAADDAGLRFPRRVWVSPRTGDVYVADGGNGRLLKYPAGRPHAGVAVALVPELCDFCVLPGGDVVTTDRADPDHCLLLWPRAAAAAADDGAPGGGGGAAPVRLLAGLRAPQRVALDPAGGGRLFITEQRGNRVLRVPAPPPGAAAPLVAEDQPTDALTGPYAAVPHGGHLYIADCDAHRILRVRIAE